MYDDNDRIEIAVGALKKLSDLHLKFMQIVRDMEGNDLPVGSFKVEDDELKATCLGVELSANHRAVVVRNGLPSILEYSFRALWNEEDIDIFKMYLEPRDNGLYEDPDSKNRVCDYDNQYLYKFVLKKVAERLLDSEVFAIKG